jgi:DNA (cytosine-5)-methyltransferase 1
MAANEDVRHVVAAMPDERTGLVLEPLRWALQAHKLGRPYQAVMLEQVPAAVLPVCITVGEALKEIGCEVVHDILRTEEFGLPQTPRRAILVARRNGEARLPKPTHRRFRQGVHHAWQLTD